MAYIEYDKPLVSIVKPSLDATVTLAFLDQKNPLFKGPDLTHVFSRTLHLWRIKKKDLAHHNHYQRQFLDSASLNTSPMGINCKYGFFVR